MVIIFSLAMSGNLRAQTTHNVSPIDDIQAVIDDAVPGDTIMFAAGIYYPPSTILINKSLMLLGPQAGIDPRPSADTTRVPGDWVTEAIIDGGDDDGVLSRIFRITADDVVIDGLEVRNGTGDMIDSPGGSGISDVILRYNIIHHALGDEGVQLRDCTDCFIEFNHVFDIAQDGINLCCSSTGGTIKFNEVHDNYSENAAIYVYDSNNTTIKNNLVYDVHVNDGIKLGSKGGPDKNNTGGSILNNIVYNTNQDGISVYMSNTLVYGNEVYHSTSENGAIYVAYPVSDVTITNNFVHNNTLDTSKWGDPGAIMIGTAVDSKTVYVNFNCFSANSPYGVTNKAMDMLDATYNWWGDPSGPSGNGPGGGDSVSANVDFSDWLGSSPSCGPQTAMHYGDVTLSGGFQAGHFPDIWDLTACDLVMSFTYDGNGLVDDFGGSAHAWSELGVRAVGYCDFNPTSGSGVWLATDYEWSVDTFDGNADDNNNGIPNMNDLDLDDKLILQKTGGQGEGDYNLPSLPPNPWSNHGIWFDRDDVDPYQAQMWGAIDRVTYNTTGTYVVVITLRADSATLGTAYMTINGIQQGFYVPDWHSGPPDLSPAGMTFTGDMTQMQVFYGLYGYGATHSVDYKNITVTGALGDDQGPITSKVVATSNPVAVNTEVILTATVDDSTTGGSTIASAEYNIVDGSGGAMSAQDGDFDEVSEGVEAMIPALTEAGVYEVCVRGTDAAGNTGLEECIFLVVYDATAGFVTGGGWIMSPEGAYTADPLLTGKANFGFIARYKKGANVPIGNTEFQFNAGDLNFHSSSYDWLVVTGSNFARFKGTGTINGSGEYKFMLWAGDGEPDTFRIKIWTEDAFGVETIEYDNGMNKAIGGGSIVVHTKKK